MSTCNRTELYAVTGHAGSGAEILRGILATQAGATPEEIATSCYTHADTDAVVHLLRVASGLDSMVLGEDQIQSQLRRALQSARSAQTLGPVLDRLGSAALACGKRVRTFTEIGRHSVSLESLAVRAVSDRMGRLQGRSLLVLGAGESARLIAEQLRAAGTHMTILGRRLERAQVLAERVGGVAGVLGDLERYLAAADAVFCCTSAPHPVMTPAVVGERPVLCVDLGMPRDVDPAVARLPNATVITLAELRQLAESHQAERQRHVPDAEAIVRVETERFLAWRRGRTTAATAAGLRAHADRVAEREAARTIGRLRELTPHERDAVQELAHRIIGKLLHAPLETLSSHPEGENIALALATAFRLPGASAALHAHLPPSFAPGEPPVHREDAAS